MAGAPAPCGVHSGQVMTVCGPVPVEELGITLMHEHLLIDASGWWHKPAEASRLHLAYQPVHMGILGELRLDPFVNLDNCRLLDVDAAAEEVGQFRDLGGRTVVDVTPEGTGRDPLALQKISRRTGLHIVMGCGFYLERTHPPRVRHMSAEHIAQELERELAEGVPGTGVHPGIIGEIGVSKDFTPEEEKALRGAARAAQRTGVPLTVHLPGWERLGHRVLDVVAEEGADLRHTVLCHMNPSLHDFEYQCSLAERGAFLGYDMIGMDFYYADQQAQCPCDEENVRAICRLVAAGYRDRILLSQDVFLKMMLTRYGGWGYGYILRHFVPRLRRHGLTDEDIHELLVYNPRRVFSAAYRLR